MSTRNHAVPLVRAPVLNMVGGLALLLGPLLGLAALPAPPVPARGDWAIEYVDYLKNFDRTNDRSLVLDGAGHPHIAYGGDRLYYAYYDGSTWHYETADISPRVGAYAALALDGSGYPHISYHDGTNGDLKYAYQWPVKCRIYLPLILK